jgi:peptidoglycan hydrolase CwlO-like protein
MFIFTLNILVSPIVEIYLKNNKYRTRNYIQGFKMKFTEIDQNQNDLEFKFERYKKLADEIMKNSDDMRKDNRKKKRKMKMEIKEIKEETVNHHKRLEKRKAEELERGAHEYANYLVSMLNAGITVANLGVSK